MIDANYFDALYANDGDPWQFRTSWYERRKRSILLAALPEARYEHAFEPGCANGELTIELALRCEKVFACDISTRAVALAQQRSIGTANATIARRRIPEEWPDRSFDLIVFNEIGYYLRAAQLQQVLVDIQHTLTADGCLVACHWLHPIPDCELDGEAVHEMLGECAALQRRATHREQDFLLETYVLRKAATAIDAVIAP